MKNINITNKAGKELNFDATLDYMDDEIREQLHSDLAPCGEQEFFTAYEKAHEEKFGEEFFLSSGNPQW
jgi:hypothetical protein